MTCAFCGDDIENHTHAFRSDTYGGLANRRTVLICGTCVLFFEYQMRVSETNDRLSRFSLSQLDPLLQWEDDGGPCLPA